jgi:uncharacterized protein (DUF4415 family)
MERFALIPDFDMTTSLNQSRNGPSSLGKGFYGLFPGDIRQPADAWSRVSYDRAGRDWTREEVGKFYRPAKRPVTIRLDVDILEWLKSEGPGYQTKATLLLRHAMVHLSKSRRSQRKKAL